MIGKKLISKDARWVGRMAHGCPEGLFGRMLLPWQEGVSQRMSHWWQGEYFAEDTSSLIKSFVKSE